MVQERTQRGMPRCRFRHRRKDMGVEASGHNVICSACRTAEELQQCIKPRGVLVGGQCSTVPANGGVQTEHPH